MNALTHNYANLQFFLLIKEQIPKKLIISACGVGFIQQI